MRGQEYKARGKTVRKMSRDGLLEENLHTRESARISQRELDVLEISGQERDSVNLQNIRHHHTDRKTGERKRKRGYVPDFDGTGSKKVKDLLNSDGRTEGAVQESQPYRAVDGTEALQKKDLQKRIRKKHEIWFRPEPDLQSETDFRPEPRLQMKSEPEPEIRLPTAIRRQRRKRQ